MLLNIVKGPKSFKDIRIVAGILHITFQFACNAYGLLGNDVKWISALEEVTLHATSYQMRHLLTMRLVTLKTFLTCFEKVVFMKFCMN